MLNNNTETVAVHMVVLRRKVSTLDTYRRGIDEILDGYTGTRKTYIQKDSENLRDLLIKLSNEGLKEETLKAVTAKINEILVSISSIAGEELFMSGWPKSYLNQYWGFLCNLKYLVDTELPLYLASLQRAQKLLRTY